MKNILLALVVIPFVSIAASLRPCLQKSADQDTLRIVWVLFTDKDAAHAAPKLSAQALERRTKAKFPGVHATDVPVSPSYIAGIERLGARRRAEFSWANAVSFSMRASALSQAVKLPFVKDILPVRSMNVPMKRPGNQAEGKTASAADAAAFGASIYEMGLENIPAAHRYCANVLKKNPGDGVIIGMFDSGFRLNHKCFNFLRGRGAVIKDSDFVEGDGQVEDADSVRAYYRAAGVSPPEEHGSWTLSLIAGYDPNKFIGVAWGARFVLAKTEWASRIVNGVIVDIELHSEEDNWAAAVVWAERMGVDVISSSVAYRTDFTDSLGRPRPTDDYTFASMDGASTIISVAASEAAKRGMLIVNSAGNDGPAAGSLNAPADARDVISVGGVNTDKTIAEFSSRGPTADNRIKPDLVASATTMYLPDIYSSDSASYRIDYSQSGTSFAAPIVAGICALIRQTHPTYAATMVRSRLYASCVFVDPPVRQTAFDNSYGRGLPDAFAACVIDSSELGSINLALYPTTLDIARKKQRLTLRLTGLPDDPLRYSQLLRVSIRSVDGTLLWSRWDYCVQNRPLSWGGDFWPPGGKLYPPGMYYCVIQYAGKIYTKKFVITG